jgi:hypothetical protein
MQWLAVPKSIYPYERIVELADDVAGETDVAWLIRCHHTANLPATAEQISSAERLLGFRLPESLHRFYRLADGGKFFVVPAPWLQPEFPNAEHIRYHIFSTAELVTFHQQCMTTFRAMLGEDPDFQHLHALDYIAFCDAHNGNYLALLLEGPDQGKVFFLHREGLFRPYNAYEFDLYYIVADSLEDWLERVIRTQGWDGFGEMMQTL